MTLLKDYASSVDYFVSLPGKIPGNWYQKYDRTISKDNLSYEDISMFRNKIVYIFFTTTDKNTMEELCKIAKSVYFINTSISKHINIVCSLSHLYDNFHSFLTNMNVDEYMNSIKKIEN